LDEFVNVFASADSNDVTVFIDSAEVNKEFKVKFGIQQLVSKPRGNKR